MPKNRHTTLQALEQTLNKIFLLNNSVEVTAGYPAVEDTTGMVAEDWVINSIYPKNIVPLGQVFTFRCNTFTLLIESVLAS